MNVGYLTITTHTGDDALPVANCRVIIRDNQGTILYDILTDANGNTETYSLKAPDPALTLDQFYTKPAYSVYDVDIIKEGFVTKYIHGVEIIATQTAILPVSMLPLPINEGANEQEDIYIPPVGLLLPADQQLQVGSNVSPFATKEVFIPEYITVHLGIPTNSAARNVRVKFKDYIKNVASSEIYPTWPDNSLIANIHVIVTFAINRVYTQWYPSRGYSFDITNSTAYDQYFVEGRNIFQNISDIVDGIFNVYARRFGFRNPFFTQFCNGTTTTCKGLSQWGTVTLANQGYTPIQILHYYYPNDLELVTSYNIQGITASFPGYALTIGSSGNSVKLMQNYLNRIRVNYPLIPQITSPDGYYNENTATAVRTFQRTFNLSPDGVIGANTWNKIIQIYVGVIRLAELDSEGERIGIGKTPPTSILSLGSRGEDVLQLQFILNAISPFYDTIPTVIKDGVYDTTTKNAVIEFQKTFNLKADGIVGRSTWNMLYSVYKGIATNAPVPPSPEVPINNAPAYPGTPLTVGSTGPNVRIMQTYLNAIRAVYNSIPPVIVDGIFGSGTREAVVAFQRQFLLPVDGVIGPITWNKIVQQFLLVTGNTSVSLAFPGTALTVGSSGSNVRLMQGFLNEIARSYPAIPVINVDGIFGPATRSAVIAFQNIYGLDPDGIIGSKTWSAIVNARNTLA